MKTLNPSRYSLCLAGQLMLGLLAAPAVAQTEAPTTPPAATIDLATKAGLELVNGQWRAQEARLVNVPFRAAGPDGQPGTQEVTATDLEPQAGARDFDDRAWRVLSSSDQRLGNGRVSFVWYRLRLKVPERVGTFATRGTTMVFETTVDDYAEVWVDGELPRALGQRGGGVIAGWNAPNRLVIGRDVQPGQEIQLAVLGMNGPISNAPTNYVWMRSARLDFYRTTGPMAWARSELNFSVRRRAPALDGILGLNPKLFKLASGFQFTEGPVWSPQDHGLYFSDPNANRIYHLSARGELSVFRDPSGYEGKDIGEYHQPGSNGITLDAKGNFVFAQHGKRRVVRLVDGAEQVLAGESGGKRLNSPNDLVLRRNGDLYFTDPPFGLPKVYDDARRELDVFGVYAVLRGKVELLTGELRGPNGIAFSPDERVLYVGNWDEKKKVVMQYPVRADGRLDAGRVLHDFTAEAGEDAIDGIKVDERGNLFVSGPGGLWVLAPSGEVLGFLVTPEHVHNMAWGGDDGRSLFLCARSSVYELRLAVTGAAMLGAAKGPSR